jgi:acetyl-CoA carboxylase carboxyl transferase subunit alpha
MDIIAQHIIYQPKFQITNLYTITLNCTIKILISETRIMDLNFLDFEQPIAELEAKISELRHVTAESSINISEEIARLENKSRELTQSIFSSLTAIQIVKLARHPQRPHMMDYVARIFTDFDELHGDRHFAKGAAIVGGTCRLDGKPVMVIGHQKGRNTKENIERNFAMANPEDYRKALRLMEMAERFKLPILTFIDTPGAYPGIAAEEHNQSEAIARNLFMMSKLRTPIICTVIGEGGSGGGLALGVGDRVLMLQYSYYATISPEGCASILWRSQEKVAEAAETMQLTADKLLKLKLIEQIVPEPLGGAHRDYDATAMSLKRTLCDNLHQLQTLPLDELIEARYQRLLSFGKQQ